MFEQYRIKKRKYSPNIIEYLIGIDSNGKPVYKSYIAPLVSKEEGDIISENLLKLYLTL